MVQINANNKKLKIFISSVFYEQGEKWEIRKRIAIKLQEQNYKPWLWEEDGEKEKKKMEKMGFSPSNQEIISNAIQSSNLVVTLYKTRAGRFFEKPVLLPFYATDFEIALASKYDIPLRLYVIGDKHDMWLKSVLSIYTESIVIDSEPRYCVDEEDVIERVVRDAETIFSTSSNKSLIQIPFTWSSPSNWFEETRYLLSEQTTKGNYLMAYEILGCNTLPKQVISITPEQKIQEARYLALSANIYANRAMYNQANNYSLKSIRLFMETGELVEMLGQIQALSGIRNMGKFASRYGINSAYWINTYGYRGKRIYSKNIKLQTDFNDSRASIFRDIGRYDDALRLLKKDDWEKSSYSAAKYAHCLGFSSKRNNMNKARKLIEYQIIPRARNQNESVAYVLFEAAFLAVKDNDIYTAKKHIDEANRMCDILGLLHTKNRIEQLQKKIIRNN